MDHRIVFRVTQEYPPVRGGGDTVSPYGLQHGVISDEVTLQTCFLVNSHGTAAEHTHPDVTPLVFRDTPDVIGHQRTTRISGTIVLPFAILIFQDTTLVGTKPQTAVLSGIAAYDDIAGHTEPLFREGVNGFQRLGVHLDDTTIIPAYPVIALPVLTDGVDITDVHTHEVRHRLRTHCHAVLIRSHPHPAQLVQIQVLTGDIRQRRLVALHIRKLPPFLRLEVQHQHPVVVGGHPQESLGVVADLPHLDILRHALKTLGAHEIRQRGVPAFLFLIIDIGTGGVCDHPDIILLIHGHPVIVIGIQGPFHIVLLPEHLTVRTIDTHQFTER